MRKYIQDTLNLRATADFDKTKAVISGGISLRGYNLWILLCSSILASIGLDTNSVAIIIGAMLISPLMSPILGVGLPVAIHDRRLLVRSLKNLSVAVLISLASSIIYFLLTPLGEATSEGQARTFPTLDGFPLHRYAFQRMADDTGEKHRHRYHPGCILQSEKKGYQGAAGTVVPVLKDSLCNRHGCFAAPVTDVICYFPG